MLERALSALGLDLQRLLGIVTFPLLPQLGRALSYARVCTLVPSCLPELQTRRVGASRTKQRTAASQVITNSPNAASCLAHRQCSCCAHVWHASLASLVTLPSRLQACILKERKPGRPASQPARPCTSSIRAPLSSSRGARCRSELCGRSGRKDASVSLSRCGCWPVGGVA